MSIESSKFIQAEKLFQKGDMEQALEVCLKHLESNSSDILANRLKAKLQGMKGDLVEAIDSISKVLELTEKREPCDFFYRGRWKLRSGDTTSACVDFQEVLELSATYSDDYYVEAAHLHLAYANAKLGNKHETGIHLNHLDSESVTSINDELINVEYIRKLLSHW